MSLKDMKPRENAPMLGRRISAAAAVQMSVQNEVVDVTLGNAAFNVSLPNVSEARGERDFMIRVVATGGTGQTVTVVDLGDSWAAISSGLTAVGKFVALRSNGYSWYVVASN